MENIKNKNMSFDEFIAYLEKFIDKNSFLQEANKVKEEKGDKNEDYKKLETKMKNINKECEKCENEMEEAIEKELKELKDIRWFEFVIPKDNLKKTPITSNLFTQYVDDSSEMERWTQKSVWTFLRRKFFGTKNKDGKIEGGMVDIKKLKQKEIEQILDMLTSPVQNNHRLPVSNLFESRCVCEKCRADDSEGIFNFRFLLQDLVDIYGIDVDTNGITIEQKGIKVDKYEKYELTEDDKNTIMTFADFDAVYENQGQFSDEYKAYEKFLLKYCGFENLNDATNYVEKWQKLNSGLDRNPNTDPQNTKCKDYYAKYLKNYSTENENYLGKLSSQLKNDATEYLNNKCSKTETYMSFNEYKERFSNTNCDHPDAGKVLEKLQRAKDQSSTDKSQNSILFSSGSSEPKTLENNKLPEYDKKNFYGVDIKGMEHQSYSAGCGSTVAATMMTYEGLDLNQYEIRTYVPEDIAANVRQNNGFGDSSCMHNPAIFSDIIIKYKNNMAVRNLVIDWNNNKRRLNFKLYVLPNLVKMVNKHNGGQILNQKEEKKFLESRTLKASDEEIKARAEYLRLCIIDAIVKHKSPMQNIFVYV